MSEAGFEWTWKTSRGDRLGQGTGCVGGGGMIGGRKEKHLSLNDAPRPHGVGRARQAGDGSKEREESRNQRMLHNKELRPNYEFSPSFQVTILEDHPG